MASSRRARHQGVTAVHVLRPALLGAAGVDDRGGLAGREARPSPPGHVIISNSTSGAFAPVAACLAAAGLRQALGEGASQPTALNTESRTSNGRTP